MRKNLKLSLVIAQLFSCLLIRAQTISPLKIGDKVPDIVFAKMLNHTAPSGKLSDFNGKAIIVDMWFKECGGCISAMPHLDSLQNEYRNDVQILLVTWQKETEIRDFWKKDLDISKFRFTQVVEDTITLKLFPARVYPHQIWINKKGIIVGITDGTSTTRSNLEKLIIDGTVNIKEKKDELDNNVRWGIEPLMNIRYDENKKNILNYTYFSRYRPELNGSVSPEIDNTNKLVRIKFSNQDYIKLYHYAYSSKIDLIINYPTRVIRKDHSDLPRELDWSTFTTLFCYDLIYKDSTGTIDNFGKYMVPDLDRFFKLKSHEETRSISCYVISPNGKGTRFRETIDPDGKKHVYNMSLKKGKLFSASRQLPSYLEANLNFHVDRPLVFDMGNEKKLNFEVVWNLDNLKVMNLELAKYDLKIEKAKRKRKVIVLKDP